MISLFAICASQSKNEMAESYQIFEQHMLMCKELLENGSFLQKFKNAAMVILLPQFPNCFIMLHGRFWSSHKLFFLVHFYGERANVKNFHF